jgi:hypothetical protein
MNVELRARETRRADNTHTIRAADVEHASTQDWGNRQRVLHRAGSRIALQLLRFICHLANMKAWTISRDNGEDEDV